jgi:hypothetical protein
MKINPLFIFVLGIGLLLGGCATVPPKDYTVYRQHMPRSILVLPPINRTTELHANYSFYTQTAVPIAEMGYYVYPVALVDRYFKENGVTVPDEMHKIPVDKLYEVFGADAVLYIDVEKYGSKYVIFSSNVVISASATLVDCRSGDVLWQGRVDHVQAGSSGLLEALVEQIVNQLADQPHLIAGQAANILLVPQGQGLLRGHRHPQFGAPES